MSTFEGESPATETPETYFAPATRAAEAELLELVEHCSNHPMLSTVLQAFHGVLAVLDRHRQILAVNAAALRLVGVEDAGEALGLRPGEAVNCAHRDDHPGGCGTSRTCASCGAAIAIVACQELDSPQEAECTMTVERAGRTLDLQLRVRTSPLHIGDHDLVLLFLEDITAQRRREGLERAFYHDLNNTMLGLQGALDLLEAAHDGTRDRLEQLVRSSSRRLTLEIQLQQVLSSTQPATARVFPRECAVAALIDEVAHTTGHHRAARGRTVQVAPVSAELRVITDPVMAHRVLTNMVLNALEAIPADGIVRVSAQSEGRGVSVAVHNDGVIPATIQPRIFQRYFSTKEGPGRGTGTFAMKLLGEDYLRGKVDFTSTLAEGTTFRLWLPRS